MSEAWVFEKKTWLAAYSIVSTGLVWSGLLIYGQVYSREHFHCQMDFHSVGWVVPCRYTSAASKSRQQLVLGFCFSLYSNLPAVCISGLHAAKRNILCVQSDEIKQQPWCLCLYLSQAVIHLIPQSKDCVLWRQWLRPICTGPLSNVPTTEGSSLLAWYGPALLVAFTMETDKMADQTEPSRTIPVRGN